MVSRVPRLAKPSSAPIVHEPLKKANSLITSSAAGVHHSLLHNAIDEPFIVHPGAVSSILHLLTTVKSELNEHVSHFLSFIFVLDSLFFL